MKWRLITSKHYTVFSRYWIIKAFNEDMGDELGKGFTKYKALYNGTYCDTEEFEEVKLHLVRKINRDSKAIWELCGKWKKDCDRLIKYTKRAESLDFSKYDNKYLVGFLEKIVNKFRKSACY